MRRVFRAILLLLSATSASLGCSSEGPADGGAAPRAKTASTARPDAREEGAPAWLESLIAAEDARDLERVAASAKSPVAAIRARAVRALGRFQTAEAIPLLRHALGDEAAEVAREAAFGLGQLGELATPEVEEGLLGKLAAEPSRGGRALLCQALGRVAGDRAVPALVRSLGDADEEVRVAAAEAFARYAMRKKAVPPEAVLVLAKRIKSDGSASVRAAGAFAFTRIREFEGEPGTAARRALEGAVSDSSADVRMMAARALSVAEPLGRPDPLARAAEQDSDWRVRVNALKSLMKRSGRRAPSVLAKALVREVRALASDRSRWGGTSVHVIATGLALAAEMPAQAALRRALGEALSAAAPENPPAEASHALDFLHCQAAFALDRMDGRPRRVETCGREVPEWRRLALTAEVIGRGKGKTKARVRKLRSMLEGADSKVRTAVLGSLAGIDHPEARAALLAALDGSDLAEVATAADGIAKQAKRFQRVDPEATEEARQIGGSAKKRAAPLKRPDPEVGAKLARALRRFSGPDDVEAALSLVGALEALESPDGAGALREVLSHPNAALRTRAVEAMKKLGAAVPSPLPSPVAEPNPIDAAAAARLVGRSSRATLRTSRGEIAIDLLADEAPGTVLNFVRIARDGGYRGLVFHRVVPNFVVQGGDPRGDGFGGPGWSIRCEHNPLRYDRGMVGMALAGKDTGGSQFFINHSLQPHLDGRYTIFGRVTRGMEVVDVLQVGDAIEDVVIEDE